MNLLDFRPQHTDACAINGGPCRHCGRPRKTLDGYHPLHPPGPNPEGHRFEGDPCDCGLERMLTLFPHVCAAGHDAVGWAGDGEVCPVCDVRARAVAAIESAGEMALADGNTHVAERLAERFRS